MHKSIMCVFNNCFVFYQSECEQKGESYWYSVTASVVTRIVENIEVIFTIVIVTSFLALCCCYSLISEIIFILLFCICYKLKIQGVHLRFEDDFSNPEKPYAFGVCIKNVSAQNCSKEPVSYPYYLAFS